MGAPDWTARAALAAIRAYKVLLSPAFAGSCRFTPSCADYAAEAIRQYGAARGLFLGLKRLSRCHPLGAWGVDPVPPHAFAASGERTRGRRTGTRQPNNKTGPDTTGAAVLLRRSGSSRPPMTGRAGVHLGLSRSGR